MDIDPDRVSSLPVVPISPVDAESADRVIDYATPAANGRRRWWHGDLWDWVGSLALVVLAFLAFCGAFALFAYIASLLAH